MLLQGKANASAGLTHVFNSAASNTRADYDDQRWEQWPNMVELMLREYEADFVAFGYSRDPRATK